MKKKVLVGSVADMAWVPTRPNGHVPLLSAFTVNLSPLHVDFLFDHTRAATRGGSRGGAWVIAVYSDQFPSMIMSVVILESSWECTLKIWGFFLFFFYTFDSVQKF